MINVLLSQALLQFRHLEGSWSVTVKPDTALVYAGYRVAETSSLKMKGASKVVVVGI